MLDKDEIEQLHSTEHRIASPSNQSLKQQISDDYKSSLEGLSERETRILVPDEFTPAVTKPTHHKHYPMETNIQAGPGLPNTTFTLGAGVSFPNPSIT